MPHKLEDEKYIDLWLNSLLLQGTCKSKYLFADLEYYKGVFMRIFLWLMLLIPLLNADVKCTIQVLSVKEKASITPEFMAKVSAMQMEKTIKYIDGKYKVFIGDFKTKDEASSHLSAVREKVSQDAFVAMITQKTPLKADAKMQQMIVLAQAKLLQASKQETSVPQADKPVKTKEEKVNTVDILGPKDKIVINKKETKTVVAMKDEAKSEEIFSEETSQDLFCKPTKRALREAEISQALSFYRNSSYYGFNEGI